MGTAAPRWLDADEARAWMAYLRGSQTVEQAVEHQLRADASLTHGEFEILARLSSAEARRLRMGELARGILVSKSRLSYLVDQLAKRGLVRREAHDGDRRGVEAVLTDEGMALLEQIAPGHVDAVRAALVDRLTADELAALAAIMVKLVD